MKKVYIVGRVSVLFYGESCLKFDKARIALLNRGCRVFNKLQVCNSKHTKFRHKIRCVFYLLFKCGSVCLLPDWAESRAGKWECFIAFIFHKKIFML